MRLQRKESERGVLSLPQRPADDIENVLSSASQQSDNSLSNLCDILSFLSLFLPLSLTTAKETRWLPSEHPLSSHQQRVWGNCVWWSIPLVAAALRESEGEEKGGGEERGGGG